MQMLESMVIRMSEEKLLDAIGKIEEEMVLEAAPKGATVEIVQENALRSVERKGDRKQRTWIKWAAMAACVCLLAGGVIKFGNLLQPIEDMLYHKDMPVEGIVSDDVAQGKNDNTTAKAEELNQDTSIDFTTTQPQDDVLNQNATAQEEGLVLGDDVMQESFPDWGLTLSAKEVTPSGLTLICTQSGGAPTGDIMTGEYYCLSVWRAGSWRTVVPVIENYGWNDLAHWIVKDADTEFKIDWEWLYGELEPGTYRLVKDFMDFRKTADYDKAFYWVEFVIE